MIISIFASQSSFRSRVSLCSRENCVLKSLLKHQLNGPHPTAKLLVTVDKNKDVARKKHSLHNSVRLSTGLWVSCRERISNRVPYDGGNETAMFQPTILSTSRMMPHEMFHSRYIPRAHQSRGGAGQSESAHDAGLSPSVGLVVSTDAGLHIQLPPKDLPPALYVVATPIGNLEDMSLRGLRVLGGCEAVLAEDTRRTRQLLNHFNITTTQLVSCHTHNEATRVKTVISRIQSGARVALVSDAGVPLVSDPGGLIVTAALQANILVVPVPGPCAAVTALVGAGLGTDCFTFLGFLQGKASARAARLQEMKQLNTTLVFYVAPHDLVVTLRELGEQLGDQRRCCVARELTKLHEEFYRGTLHQATDHFTNRGVVRGEVTVLVEGAGASEVPRPSQEALTAELTFLMTPEGGSLPASAAAKQVASQSGMRKNELYKLALEIKKTSS